MIKIDDLWSGRNSLSKNIRFKSSMLASNLYDYSDAHVIVKGELYVLTVGANENDKTEKICV